MRNPAYLSLTDQQLAEIDELCDRFDRELLDGNSPRIETFLEDAPYAAEDGLLAELLAMELEYRTQQLDAPQQEDYLSRFPQQESVIASVFSGTEKTHFRNDETISAGTETVSIPGDVTPDLDNFRLIEEIGRGGMGVVWLAEQLQPVKRRVALKLIKSEWTSKDVIDRFDAEKQALAMMDHQSIARVFDAGTTQAGRPYFVMEFVDGIPITQYCDDNRLSVDQRLKLLVPVCKAVQHAHQKGIIHRDLKPSNVLVTVIDGEAVPKVIDFGLAKAVEQNVQLTDATMLTEFGKVVGTVQYMSPEQAELKGMDAEDVDTRTDIYSLGVMLYELLTGSTPLDKNILGRSALLKVLEIIRIEDPPRPSNRLSSSSNEVNSKVGQQRSTHPARLQQLLKGELDWVVMKALEKDRNRRYQTANDLAQDLSNYLAGETVAARPPSTWYQIQKFAKRNRGLVASILAIGLALVGGMIGTSYGLIQANQKAAEATTNEQLALREKDNARKNEERAIGAEELASAEAKRAHDSEAAAKFQLANARWEANRALEARNLLHEIPVDYRDNFEWHYFNRHFLGSDITCYGHVKAIYGVAFSPDGEQVASASADNTIKLWNARTGEEISTLKGHTKTTTEVAFSPDGKRLASCSIDNTVKVWDAQSGQEIATLKGHTNWIMDVVFSPDGELIASASDDHTIRLWDAKTFEEINAIKGHTREVQSVSFSPDSARLASSSVDTTVKLWDVTTGEEITTFMGHNERVINVAFSPDGTRIASASNNNILLWNADTFQQITKLQGHTNWVHSVAFSPDGMRLASGCAGTTIKLWDAWNGQEITTLNGHTDGVNGVAFSPDGSRLVSASDDRTVKLWDMRTAEEIITLDGHASWVRSIAFSPDGTRLASAGTDRTIKLWDAQSGQQVVTLNGHTQDITSVAFSPDGAQLASASRDNTIKLWDARSGIEFATLNGHTSEVRSVAFSPDSSQLASASDDRTVKLWNARSGKKIATLNGHGQWVSAVAFSPDGAYLATGSWDATIKLWDTQTFLEITTLESKSEAVLTVAFSPDSQYMASGSYEGVIKLWNVKTRQEVATLIGHAGAVFSLAFSPDGRRLASASGDETVRLWDARSGREITTIKVHSDRVYSVAFSPDGTQLASSGRDKKIKLLDARKDREIISLKGHTNPVTSITFGRDGTQLFSRSGDEEFVWNVATKKQIDGATWDPPANKKRISPDGRWLATREGNDVVLVDLENKQNPRERVYRNAKTKFDRHWHRRQAKEASSTDHWFAATFHFAWLIMDDPDQAEYYDGLNSSYQKLAASFDKDEEDIDSRLATVVEDALKLPRGRVLNNANESQAINHEELHLHRDLVERHRRGLFFQSLAMTDFQKGNFTQAIRFAVKSVAVLPKGDVSYSSPILGGYAILAMSHFKLGDMEQANDYHKKFDAAMMLKAFSDDPKRKLFAEEVKELFASQPDQAAATK